MELNYATTIKSLWTSLTDIVETISVVNPITKLRESEDKVVATKVPCRISFKRFNPSSDSNTVSQYIQQTVILLSSDYMIKPGTKFIVTQNGRTITYSCSSEPAVYTVHQEIEVTKEAKA